MKNTILIVALCLSLFACDNKEEAVPEVLLEKQAVVALRETVVPTQGNSLKVELLSVNDSRCPVNVNCVIAGSAMLKFAIAEGDAKTEVAMEFGVVDRSKNIVKFLLAGKNYTLHVTEVLPYPETSNIYSLEDYKVSVSIAQD